MRELACEYSRLSSILTAGDISLAEMSEERRLYRGLWENFSPVMHEAATTEAVIESVGMIQLVWLHPKGSSFWLYNFGALFLEC